MWWQPHKAVYSGQCVVMSLRGGNSWCSQVVLCPHHLSLLDCGSAYKGSMVCKQPLIGFLKRGIVDWKGWLVFTLCPFCKCQTFSIAFQRKFSVWNTITASDQNTDTAPPILLNAQTLHLCFSMSLILVTALWNLNYCWNHFYKYTSSSSSCFLLK